MFEDQTVELLPARTVMSHCHHRPRHPHSGNVTTTTTTNTNTSTLTQSQSVGNITVSGSHDKVYISLSQQAAVLQNAGGTQTVTVR